MESNTVGSIVIPNIYLNRCTCAKPDCKKEDDVRPFEALTRGSKNLRTYRLSTQNGSKNKTPCNESSKHNTLLSPTVSIKL